MHTVFNNLVGLINKYNAGNKMSIPVKRTFLEYYVNMDYAPNTDYGSTTSINLLSQLTQVQMVVLQNERGLLAFN
jgi:hypothetical protein